MSGYPPQHANWSPPPPTGGDSTRPPSLHGHPEFQSIRGAFRAFGTTAVAVVVGGFLLYVLLSHFVPPLMNFQLAGHLTLGLAIGLAQFAVMAVTVWRYTTHMRRQVDPVARRLRAELDRVEPGRPTTPQEGRSRSW